MRGKMCVKSNIARNGDGLTENKKMTRSCAEAGTTMDIWEIAQSVETEKEERVKSNHWKGYILLIAIIIVSFLTGAVLF